MLLCKKLARASGGVKFIWPLRWSEDIKGCWRVCSKKTIKGSKLSNMTFIQAVHCEETTHSEKVNANV